MTLISKNVNIDKLDDIVNAYNKPIDVKDNTYINIDKEVNDNDPKFKVGFKFKIQKHFCYRLYSKLV